MWPLAEVRGTCSGGSKRQVIGEGFRARRAIQAHANPRTQYLLHLTLKFPTSHLICGILNVINVVRHYMLGDEKVFPDTMPYPIYLLSSFAKLINYKPIHNQPYCVPHLRNKLEQWPKSGTPGSPMAKTGYPFHSSPRAPFYWPTPAQTRLWPNLKRVHPNLATHPPLGYPISTTPTRLWQGY